jgi:hypothetical protein
MPTNTHRALIRTWHGFRKSLRSGGNRSCTVTFNYGERGLRTLVAPNFRAACDDAAARWGADWLGEPCYSTPDTIYNDLTGYTKAQHGQDFGASDHWRRKTDRFRRTGSRDLPKPKATR